MPLFERRAALRGTDPAHGARVGSTDALDRRVGCVPNVYAFVGLSMRRRCHRGPGSQHDRPGDYYLINDTDAHCKICDERVEALDEC